MTTPFQGGGIFAGVDNHVEILSEVDGLEFVPRTRLLTFIEEIAEEAQHTDDPINTQSIIQPLEKYETKNGYLPDPVTEEKNGEGSKRHLLLKWSKLLC